jgi:quercetin dioxygenase-like cupin family protein
MKSHFKIATGFNVCPLREALNAQPELFGQHVQRAQTYMSPHAAMKDVWVRYNDITKYTDLTHFNDEHDSVWYPAYDKLPELKQIVFRLMGLVNGERLGGVLITKIPPGGSIAPHTDSGWHAGYYSKFYIPIQNGEGAKFCFADGEINPSLGDVWCFDNSVPHWVENNSTEDRIALIVCIRTEEYPRQLHDSKRTIQEFKENA